MNPSNGDQPASPQHGWSSVPGVVDRMQSQQGLTKREMFAMAAMQGLCADPSRSGDCQLYALEALKLADELLKALEVNL